MKMSTFAAMNNIRLYGLLHTYYEARKSGHGRFGALWVTYVANSADKHMREQMRIRCGV
jgi:hypothetical protein